MKKILILLALFLSFNALYAETTSSFLSITGIDSKTLKIYGTTEGLIVKGMENKVVLLEFFGHRCPPCLASIPNLIKLQNELKEQFTIIAIEVQGLNNEDLTKFAQNKGINYFVASYENGKELVEYIGARAQWSGGIPFSILLDTKGNVQMMHAGMIPQEALEKMVKEVYTTSQALSIPKSDQNSTNTENNISIKKPA